MTELLKNDPRRAMTRELAAAAALKEQLIVILGDSEVDTATLGDMIEGETDLFDMIDGVIEQIAQDTARVDGIAKFETTLAGRKSRLESRIGSLRAMLTNALDMMEQRKLERPLATITLKPIPRKLKITDEALIPSMFYVQPGPIVSNRELGNALKARAAAFEALADEFKSSAMTEPELLGRRAEIDKKHPAIPGATLDDGGITIQLRFG